MDVWLNEQPDEDAIPKKFWVKKEYESILGTTATRLEASAAALLRGFDAIGRALRVAASASSIPGAAPAFGIGAFSAQHHSPRRRARIKLGSGKPTGGESGGAGLSPGSGVGRRRGGHADSAKDSDGVGRMHDGGGAEAGVSEGGSGQIGHCVPTVLGSDPTVEAFIARFMDRDVDCEVRASWSMLR